MNDYQQPSFYRFNQDSIRLINHILKNEMAARSILDLGAGSGIIGLELAQKLKPIKLELLELQKEYLPFLDNNSVTFAPSGTEVLKTICSFKEYNPQQKFSLISCNPPYYLPGRGELSPNVNRQLARTFIQDNWSELLGCIHRSLEDNGPAYLVLKNEALIRTHVENELTKFSFTSLWSEDEDLFFLKLVRLNKD